ncbi:MAG: Phosphoglycolate phosphatase [Syntrophaceae bacterium PtaU1.Bin231]|nr:MAG: Phosphoglycolate phosphatase [Syntrophaceae bacterium PtaU1.Bin231]
MQAPCAAARQCGLWEDIVIRALLFDFGQTLVDSAEGFRAAEKEAERAVFEFLGDVSWEDFLDAYRRLRKELHGRSNFSRQDLFRGVCQSAGREPETERLVQWENRYWERVRAATKLFPETLAVLSALRPKYRLGMITNTQGQRPSVMHRLREVPALPDFFEVIVVAGEAGVPPKPDPLPFRACLERMGLRPEEAAYVGDDWRIDVLGARGAGMRAIWLRHESVRRNWPDVDADAPVITRLDALLSVDRLLK